MNFQESRVFEQMTIKEAFVKAKDGLARDEIDLSEFEGVFGEEVEQDRKYVDKMESRFKAGETGEEKEGRMLATILEAIIHEQAELSDWLGPDATTIKPSRYDDIANGVDELVEFQGEEETSYLAMAIDVTFGEDVAKKFTRIKEEIDRGVLGEVKYFFSEYTGKRKKLENVPRVVIGADARTVKELADLWVEGKKKELGGHKIQFQILDEILIQAEAFHNYANKFGHDNVALAYREMARKIEEIIKEKFSGAGSQDSGERDERFYDIRMMLKKFK